MCKEKYENFDEKKKKNVRYALCLSKLGCGIIMSHNSPKKN